MARTMTIPNSAPRNTQAAAHEVGCNTSTLRNYIREGEVSPPRTPSGRLCWFDEQIEQARNLFNRRTGRAG